MKMLSAAQRYCVQARPAAAPGHQVPSLPPPHAPVADAVPAAATPAIPAALLTNVKIFLSHQYYYLYL